MKGCLSKQMIRDFLADCLDDQSRELAVSHIEGCALCQKNIEQLLEQQTVYEFASDATKVTGLTLTNSRFSKISSAIRDTGSESSEFESVPPGLLPDLDGYLIESELGRGGSGVVYKAMQHELDRVVAIKILSGNFSARLI